MIYLNYCLNSKNWLTKDCQNFYENIYTTGDTIDPSVSYFLTKMCATQKVGDSTSSNVCGCYYPASVYSKFRTDNNITDFEQSDKQCYYPYCFSSSNPPYYNPKCPNITNCNATVINSLSAGGDMKNNKTVVNLVQNCQNKTKNVSTKSSPAPSPTPSPAPASSKSTTKSKYTKVPSPAPAPSTVSYTHLTLPTSLIV